MDRPAKDQIKAAITEVKSHHDKGPYRIRAYYHEPDVSQFDTAPHDQQFKQAAAYIDYSISEIGVPLGWDEREENMTVKQGQRRDWVKEKLEDLVYAIALETIVSAAHMKIHTPEYLSHLANNDGRTPHINVSKERVLDDLSRDLSEEAVEEIDLTLDLAKELRDNVAHFGFHYHGGHTFPVLFITVSGFLIQSYADTEEIPELESMKDYCEDYYERRVNGEIYPVLEVDFEPF